MQNKKDLLKKIIPEINKIDLNHLNKKQMQCADKILNHYSNSLYNDKSKIRKLLKEERSKIDLKTIKRYSLKLNKKIIRAKEFKKSKTVFCYISFDNEIDTFYLLEHCLKTNKVLCVPVIKGGKMIAGRVENLKSLIKNKYGILEPSVIIEIDKNEIDLIIVPALGYNPLGFRVGYGKGYYDNFLKDYNGYTIGMVLKKFVTADLIPDIYDVPVKKIICL